MGSIVPVYLLAFLLFASHCIGQDEPAVYYLCIGSAHYNYPATQKEIDSIETKLDLPEALTSANVMSSLAAG